ncbi:MAG: hypothetical protein DMG15_22950 [Acidobacteria bacterium]|nr:MAG: hypothetical protein DMG16_01280 [Acidobacteriota bacterium]PYS09743.1 MAG: hypothetical protein DMG15_22950 [Acidobacteriota bacterium]
MGGQGQYFSEKKVRRITQLLSSTDMTIKEIAERMSCSRTTVSSINRKFQLRLYGRKEDAVANTIARTRQRNSTTA